MLRVHSIMTLLALALLSALAASAASADDEPQPALTPAEVFVGRWVGFDLAISERSASPLRPPLDQDASLTPRLVFLIEAGFSSRLGAGRDVYGTASVVCVVHVGTGVQIDPRAVGHFDLEGAVRSELPEGAKIGDLFLVSSRVVQRGMGQAHEVVQIVEDSDAARRDALADRGSADLEWVLSRLDQFGSTEGSLTNSLDRVREQIEEVESRRAANGPAADPEYRVALLGLQQAQQSLRHTTNSIRLRLHMARRAAELWIEWGPDDTKGLARQVLVRAQRELDFSVKIEAAAAALPDADKLLAEHLARIGRKPI